jgi:hypothetical protein
MGGGLDGTGWGYGKARNPSLPPPPPLPPRKRRPTDFYHRPHTGEAGAKTGVGLLAILWAPREALRLDRQGQGGQKRHRSAFATTTKTVGRLGNLVTRRRANLTRQAPPKPQSKSAFGFTPDHTASVAPQPSFSCHQIVISGLSFAHGDTMKTRYLDLVIFQLSHESRVTCHQSLEEPHQG